MRDDVRIASIQRGEGDDEPALAHALREARMQLEQVSRERDAHRMLRDSWAAQWERDQHLRADAERRVAEAERLLARARDLLEGWSASHPDPGLAPRTRRVVEDIDVLLRGDAVW
jgi:hypothetical protein